MDANEIQWLSDLIYIGLHVFALFAGVRYGATR